MMKNPNKIIKAFLWAILIMTAVFLAACGGDKKSETKTHSDISGTDTSDKESKTADGDTTGTGPENGDSGTEPVQDETDDDSDTGSDTTEDSDDTPPDDSDTSVVEPVFVRQPEKINIAPYNRSVTLSCEAEAGNREIIYQWYETPDGSTDTGTAIPEAAGTTFSTPVLNEKGIQYYYCVASVAGSDAAALASNVASVAHTALPTVFIETPDNIAITSKEEWIKNAHISMVGSEESWNFENVSTSIRGRGNTTWSKPKKSYALKLDKKQKIMGLPSHKRWVLIANYLDNTFMRNETAFYLSRTFEMDWTVHGDFVDLVLNGEYKGLYWLGEAIKVDKNRVNINDGNPDMSDSEDKDYLVEMDQYYDEPVKFRSAVRDLPYMIKNDDYMIDDNGDLSSGGQERIERFRNKINSLENLLYPDFTEGTDTNSCSAPDPSYAEIIDIDSWVKFWFVNEIMDSPELSHPKSAYFTFDSTNNIFKAGPVWDFDWSSLAKHSNCRLKASIYYNALFKSPAFKTKVKELWNKYSGSIDIETFIEPMRKRLDTAAAYDTMLWGEHDDPSGVKRENFDAYVDFLKEALFNKISVINTDVSKIE